MHQIRITMKKSIFKKLALSVALLSTTFARAIDFGFERTIKEFMGEVIRVFPWVAVGGLVIAFIFAGKHFQGENADASKGIRIIIVYVLFVAICVGAYQAIKAMANNVTM